jgi:uncharacterized protein
MDLALNKRQETTRHFPFFSRSTTLVVQALDTSASHESRVDDYLRKITVLKQIMSNKARFYRAINAIQNIMTVVVSSILLFIGFSGPDKIKEYVSWIYPFTKDGAEFGFNFLVFLLFIMGVLHLVFRFTEKQSVAERAVASLAALGNELDDLADSLGTLVTTNEPMKVDLLRARYEGIALNIPPNSDREFIRAKRDLANKSARKSHISINPRQLFDAAEQERIVSSIALGSRAIVDVLKVLSDIDPSLYLGGGLIRNAVWDYLHGYSAPTPVDDVDVIYFNTHHVEKYDDEELNLRLSNRIPNVRWSAKNQARMHLANNEPAYSSIDQAVSQ